MEAIPSILWMCQSWQSSWPTKLPLQKISSKDRAAGYLISASKITVTINTFEEKNYLQAKLDFQVSGAVALPTERQKLFHESLIPSWLARSLSKCKYPWERWPLWPSLANTLGKEESFQNSWAKERQFICVIVHFLCLPLNCNLPDI